MDSKIELIMKNFPECVIESRDHNGNLKHSIDFDVLRQILGDQISDDPEAYRFDWVGKNSARIDAYRKIDKTLRPDLDSSLNFDSTENLYIEGDNLDVLKLLQQSYFKKIKLIYIDPPYNTGHDFIYKDRFEMDSEEYAEAIDLFDENGNRKFVENSDSNPRFHSDWCSMIYSRLLLARNLLSDDGAIFISIDDNEQSNLKKICDEVFGGSNFVANFIINSAPAGTQSASNVSVQHSYCLCYAKIISNIEFLIKRSKEELSNRYSDSDGNGNFYCERLWKRGVGGRKEDVPTLHFPVYFNPETKQILIDSEYNGEDGFIKIIPYHTAGVLGRWTWSRERMISMRNNLIVKKVAGEWKLHKKVYESEETGKLPFSIIDANIGRTEIGGLEVKNIFDGKKVFEYPKSVDFIKHFLNFIQDDDFVVMDFFSGSATTAHAVMQLNSEDHGNRKFIMVQLPEVCPENSEAFKSGFKNICEIGKERIRRAGSNFENIDRGFRVLKLDSTNFRDVSISPEELTREKLFDLIENIKSDRSPLDLLFECLIDWGIELNLKLELEEFEGSTILNYNAGDLIACFDKNISKSVIEFMASKNPNRVVFRDESFSSDSERINSREIFKLHSPNTRFKVI
ncbi:MAG: site-specific DNA-methyltransferase [Selenomonadaceae bacterium]|nr:site-specific DNA-methyltransferase [Selenomonadaceae bacterium]